MKYTEVVKSGTIRLASRCSIHGVLYSDQDTVYIHIAFFIVTFCFIFFFLFESKRKNNFVFSHINLEVNLKKIATFSG